MKKEKYITLVDGKYYRIRIRNDDGVFSKYVTISEYPSAAKALAAAKAIRDQALIARHSKVLVTKSPTVEELFERSFDLFGYSLKTWKKHRTIYNTAISSFGHKEITSIKTADIMESITDYVQTHSDDATDRLISVWHSIYQTAQMMDIPVVDHTMAVRKAKPKSKLPVKERPVLASDEDILHFMDELAQYGISTEKGKHMSRVVTMLIQVMMFTGCRPAEALALQRSDIDLIKSEISISKSIGSTHTDPGRKVRSTKTRQSVRKIPISKELKNYLIEHLANWNHDLLFCEPDGSPFEIDKLCNYVLHVSKAAGVKITLYMFRHKFSTDMVKLTDLRTVQDLMGHESGAMTLSYARSTEEERRSAIENRKLS